MTGSITSATPIGSNPFFPFYRWISPNHIGLTGYGKQHEKLLASCSFNHAHKQTYIKFHICDSAVAMMVIIFHFNGLEWYLHSFWRWIARDVNEFQWTAFVVNLDQHKFSRWNWQAKIKQLPLYSRWHMATSATSVYLTLQTFTPLAVWFVFGVCLLSIYSFFYYFFIWYIVLRINSILIKLLYWLNECAH